LSANKNVLTINKTNKLCAWIKGSIPASKPIRKVEKGKCEKVKKFEPKSSLSFFTFSLFNSFTLRISQIFCKTISVKGIPRRRLRCVKKSVVSEFPQRN